MGGGRAFFFQIENLPKIGEGEGGLHLVCPPPKSATVDVKVIMDQISHYRTPCGLILPLLFYYVIVRSWYNHFNQRGNCPWI